MYDLKEDRSRAFDALGLEVPFAELPPAAAKPAPAAEHFAFAESPFAELEEPETESLAWHDLEADEQESAWRDEGGGEGEWLEEAEEEEEPDCPHCGSRVELEAKELTEEGVRFPSGLVLYPVSGPTGRGEDQYDPHGINLPLLNTNAQTHDQLLSPKFKVRELITSGGRPALVALISPALVVALQAIRDRANKPITITSGYRSFKRNKVVYAGINAKRKANGLKPVRTTNSRHSSGQAVDLKISGMSGLALAKLAIDAAGTDLGIGIAADYIHLDVRGTFEVWNYGGAPAGSIEALRRYRERVLGGVAPSNSASALLPAAIPATPILPATQPVVPLPDEIVRIANQEFARWNVPGAALVETDVAATPILQQYYREYRDGVRPEKTAAQLQNRAWHRRAENSWSAVFISWVMRTAGAGATFRYTRGHWVYITTAKHNRLQNNAASPFWAYGATEVAPQVGDIVCKSRGGSGATYDNIGDGSEPDTHGDIVTEVRQGSISVIGGNVGGTNGAGVGRRELNTRPDGRLSLAGRQAVYFAVVRCRGAANVLHPTPEAWGEQHNYEGTGWEAEAFEDDGESEWIDEQSLNFDRQIAPALPAPKLKPCEQQILDLVAKSELPRSGWKDSSRAPLGYLNGMALTFARVYCKFKRGDWYAQQMARAPKPGTQATDALAHLAQRFRRSRMSVSVDGADTLRHLFVMLFGLGMRESGGKFFVGVDRSAQHTNRSEIEAGLFQMSHSIGVANPARVALHGIYEYLRMIPYDGYLSVFAQGLRLQGKSLTDDENSPVGLFRNFCLTQPALCAELAALGARVRRRHWGPINRQTVELLPKCNALLKEIQALVDTGLACDCFLPADWQPAIEPAPAPAPPTKPGRHLSAREAEYSDEELDAWGEDLEDSESAAADHLDEYEGEDQEAWEAATDLEAEFEGDFESGDLREWEDVFSADMENEKPRAQAPSRQSAILPGKNWTFRSQALSADVELYVPTAAINRTHDVELLVYVHGHLHACYKDIRAVPQLLAPMTEPGLGQIVESSGRPLVLVVPRLQSLMKKESWRAGGLEKPATFNAVMAEVRQEIAQKFNRSALDISRLVLAGHSRAYGVLHPLITSHTSPEMDRGALAKLTHIWPIDATYRTYSPRFPKPEAKLWLARRPSLVLHISYNPKSATNDFREYCPPQRMILNPVCGKHCELQGPVLSTLISTLPTLAINGAPVVQPELEQFDDEDWIDRDEAWHAPAALESDNLDTETEGWDGEFDPEEEEDEATPYLEDRELDPALTSLAERVMSREGPRFELDSPKRWTRCFAQATIDQLVQGYKDNQAAADANRIDRNSCIVMLNVGLGQLLDVILKEGRARSVSDRRVRMANLPTESIQAAMKALQKGGYALPPKCFEFYDRRRHTAGTLKPETLKLSVLQYVLALSKAEGCWFAFGLSIMDGYHSVLLLVHRRPDGARVYWLDQFSAGLTVDVTSTLDDVLTEKTKTFWQGVMDSKNKGYNTTIQLWPLRRKSR